MAKIDYADGILKLRAKLNLSQEELAKLLGVSFMSVNRWENGKYEPTIKAKRKLKVLCLEYNIKFEDFELKDGAKNGK